MALALAAATVVVPNALAGNGGFAPVVPESPNAHHIRQSYLFISIFVGAIFVLVETILIVFVFRYRRRRRPRFEDGAPIHGATNLELMWTAFPVVVLFLIATFIFVKLPGIVDVPAAGASGQLEIRVTGRQFYWQFEYPNGVVTIDTMRAPAGVPVRLRVTSPPNDVIHSWWIPALGGKIQAIPGRINHTWFRANTAGTFTGQCAELCGVFHASMLATVQAESARSYHTYVTRTAPATIGQQEWSGVCATCHGNLGQGGYGPAISSNTVITQPAALAGILREGVTGSAGAMPPVGDTWTNGQILALVHYLRKNIYKPAPLGATSGG